MDYLQLSNDSLTRSAFIALLFWVIGHLMHRFIADRYKAPFWLTIISGLPRKDGYLSQTGTVAQYFGIMSMLLRFILGIDFTARYGQLFVLVYLIITVSAVILMKRNQK